MNKFMSVYGFVGKGGRRPSVPVSSHNPVTQNHSHYSDGKSGKRANEDNCQPAAKRSADSHREDQFSNIDLISFHHDNNDIREGCRTSTSTASSSFPNNKNVRQIALPSSLPPDSTTDDLPTSVPPREYWLLKMRVTDGSVNIMDYWDKCGKRWDMEGLKEDLENVIGAIETTEMSGGHMDQGSSARYPEEIPLKNRNTSMSPKCPGELKCTGNITEDATFHVTDLNTNLHLRADNTITATDFISQKCDGNNGNRKELVTDTRSERKEVTYPEKELDKDVNEEIANWMLEEETEG